MHVIPQSWSHLHILISVFPFFGLVIVLGFLSRRPAHRQCWRDPNMPDFSWPVGAVVCPDLFQRRRFDGGAVE